MAIDEILETYADRLKKINYELVPSKDGKLHFYNDKKEKEITLDTRDIWSIKRLTKEEKDVFFDLFEELTGIAKR